MTDGHALGGSSALVTGAGAGLGRAIAERLAGEGARVAVADVDEDGVRGTVGAVEDAGGAASSAVGDVTSPADAARMVAAARELGPLRTLVLAAAVEPQASILDTSDEDWRRALDVNLKGPFLCMQAAVPAMIEAGGGAIVALSSILGHIGSPGFAAYSASKGGLLNLCKQVAIEHAADGVRANVLSPSATDTGAFARMVASAPDPGALRDQVSANVPMGRLGSAEDVCDAVVFLATDASRYTSGTALPLDGGLAARRSS